MRVIRKLTILKSISKDNGAKNEEKPLLIGVYRDITILLFLNIRYQQY